MARITRVMATTLPRVGGGLIIVIRAMEKATTRIVSTTWVMWIGVVYRSLKRVEKTIVCDCRILYRIAKEVRLIKVLSDWDGRRVV